MPRNTRHRRRCLAAGACLAALVGPAPGLVGQNQQTVPAAARPAGSLEDNELEILILQALDQKTALNVQDVPMPQAVQQLADSTGIPIEMEPGTLDLLPYGSKTRLSATIEGHPLRESLAALLHPLGLEFVPQKKRVVVRPTAPLRRIARRATWEELATLGKLYSQPWSRELFESLELQFQDSPADNVDENRETLYRLADAVGAGIAAQVLEHACDQYGWSWHPAGRQISVLTKARQVQQQLQTRVSLRYNQISLTDALVDLTRRAGVLLRMDPGVLSSLPPQTAERFSLSIENATVHQVLEVVAGQTGLGYFIEPDGIRMTTNTLAPANVDSAAAGVDAAARALQALKANPFVGQITIPNEDGSSFAFFIREKDLPPEVNEMRRAKIHDAINRIRRSLLKEQPQD